MTIETQSLHRRSKSPLDSPREASGLRGEDHTTQASAEAVEARAPSMVRSAARDRSSVALRLTSRSLPPLTAYRRSRAFIGAVRKPTLFLNWIRPGADWTH